MSSKEKKTGKRMKWWKKTLIVLAVLIVLLIATGYFWLDAAAAGAIRRFGTAATGTKVELQDFSTALIRGRVSLDHLAVANPSGYAHPTALEFSSLTVKLDSGSLFGDTVIIEEIAVDGLAVDFEAKASLNPASLLSLNLTEILGAESNLTTIQHNIDDYVAKMTGSGAKSDGQVTEPAATEETAEAKPKKKVLIRLLTVRNSSIRFSNSLLNSTVEIPLPDFEKRDIGEQQDYANATAAFFDVLYRQVGLAVLDYLKENGTNLGGAVKAELDSVGGAVTDELRKLW